MSDKKELPDAGCWCCLECGRLTDARIGAVMGEYPEDGEVFCSGACRSMYRTRDPDTPTLNGETEQPSGGQKESEEKTCAPRSMRKTEEVLKELRALVQKVIDCWRAHQTAEISTADLLETGALDDFMEDLEKALRDETEQPSDAQKENEKLETLLRQVRADSVAPATPEHTRVWPIRAQLLRLINAALEHRAVDSDGWPLDKE